MSMTILEFNIEYKTQWGEELCIVGSVPQMGGLDEEKEIGRASCRERV